MPWSLAAMQIFAIIAVIISIYYAYRIKKTPIIFNKFYILIIVYICFQLLSGLISSKPSYSLMRIFHNDWFLIVLLFLASMYITIDDQRKILIVLILSSTMVGLYGISQFFTGFQFGRNELLPHLGTYYRAMGGYNFYLTYAGNQLLSLGLAFSFLLNEETWNRKKFLYLGCTIILIFSIIATFGRSTWIAMTFILLLGTILVNRRYFMITFGSLIVISLISIFITPAIFERIISIFDLSQNEARLNIWQTSIAMFKAHPIFGVGPGLFNDYFPIFQVPGFYDSTSHAHNDYINMAANSGLLGLLSWITMWIGWFYFSIKAYISYKNFNTEKIILLGSILSISGILIAAFFQNYYTDLENNIFIWFVAANSLLILNRKNVKSDKTVVKK